MLTDKSYVRVVSPGTSLDTQDLELDTKNASYLPLYENANEERRCFPLPVEEFQKREGFFKVTRTISQSDIIASWPPTADFTLPVELAKIEADMWRDGSGPS